MACRGAVWCVDVLYRLSLVMSRLNHYGSEICSLMVCCEGETGFKRACHGCKQTKIWLPKSLRIGVIVNKKET